MSPIDNLPIQFQYTSPFNGEMGLKRDAGKTTTLKLTSYDRFLNKQLWTPVLGGDIFQIQMTSRGGAHPLLPLSLGQAVSPSCTSVLV